MHVMMFRAKAKPKHVDDLEAAVKTMFAAINAHNPQGSSMPHRGSLAAPRTLSCWRSSSPLKTRLLRYLNSRRFKRVPETGWRNRPFLNRLLSSAHTTCFNPSTPCESR